MAAFYFGTVGSPKSTPPKPGGSAGAIYHIKTLGLDALELGWVQSVRVTEATCAAIKIAGEMNDVKISVHAPYFINLNASEEEWEKSRKRLMDAAYYGYLAGATDIIFHPGSYFNQPRNEVLDRAIIRLSACVNELRNNKIDVVLRPETMGKSALLGTLEDTVEISRAISGVQPCIDFAHLHARAGDNSMNSYREWIELLNGYAHYLGESSLSSLHIHLSGIAYGAKGEKEHLAINDSDLDVAELFKALADMNCKGRILCESPILEEDAIYLRDKWQEYEAN